MMTLFISHYYMPCSFTSLYVQVRHSSGLLGSTYDMRTPLPFLINTLVCSFHIGVGTNLKVGRLKP